MARLTNAWNNETFTENGAVAFNSTTSKVLDLFSSVGAIRVGTKRAWNQASMNNVQTMFEAAFNEDRKLATKVAFWARDVRGGAGEREAFRIMLRFLHKHDHSTFLKVFKLVPEYGRWDDLVEFYYDESVVTFVGNQLMDDLRSEHPSLLAKWMPSENAGKASRKQAAAWVIAFAQLDYARLSTMRSYRKTLTQLRGKIQIVESLMSAQEWDEINYERVPSRAAMIYRKAFQKHDPTRYQAYLNLVEKGEKKIHSGVLAPYELVEALDFGEITDKTIELQWDNLPNWITQDNGILVMADVSGSMNWRPMAVSISLALYCAERLTGEFKNTFLTFSSNPELVAIRGRNLSERLVNISRANWGMSTDINRAFDKILQVAKRNNMTDAELPKTVVIVSDMQFNAAGGNHTNFEAIKQSYARSGYTMPNIVFWNCAEAGTKPVTTNEHGVMLVSGVTSAIFKGVCESKFVTPYDAMLDVINSDRYNLVAEALS